MARYTAESRERLREAIDFAEVVGARTELRQAGARRMTGLCPFHEERTPSFGIDPVDKLYYCFGCGAGGDVFRFVMETEGLDFPGALESLATRFGVELEREAEDPRAAQRRSEREPLYAVLERAAAYYVRTLWESDEAEHAREYLQGRGLDEGVLRQFRVGFSPTGWDRLVVVARRAGFSEEQLLGAGLASRSSRDGRLIDRFRGRVMFPLSDLRGRVIGFGARSLDPDDQPKYLNSSESDVFHKGTFVYGGDVARPSAARAGRTVLVEGYTDVLALHQAGIGEAVAVMGTSLTERQAGELRKLAPSVVLCLDADAAGQEAMLRAARVMAGQGLDPRVAPLPPGTDPADADVEVVRAAIERAMPFARFEVEHAVSSGDLATADGRDRVLAAAAPAIAGVGAGALHDELVRLLSDRLNLTPELVEGAIHAAGPAARAEAAAASERRVASGNGRTSGVRAVLSRREDTERAFLALCVALPEEGERRLGEADLDELFDSPLVRRAAAHLRGRLATPAADLPEDDEPLARLIAELVIRAGQLEASPAVLELEALQLELARLDRSIAAARAEGTELLMLAAERQKVHEAIRRRLQ